MIPDQVKQRNVIGTLLVELSEAVATDDPSTGADVAARTTNATMDQSSIHL